MPLHLVAPASRGPPAADPLEIYLSGLSALEEVQRFAGHANVATTALYVRRTADVVRSLAGEREIPQGSLFAK